MYAVCGAFACVFCALRQTLHSFQSCAAECNSLLGFLVQAACMSINILTLLMFVSAVKSAIDVLQIEPLPLRLPSPAPSAARRLSALQHNNSQEALAHFDFPSTCYSAMPEHQQCLNAAASPASPWPMSCSSPCLPALGEHLSRHKTTKPGSAQNSQPDFAASKHAHSAQTRGKSYYLKARQTLQGR